MASIYNHNIHHAVDAPQATKARRIPLSRVSNNVHASSRNVPVQRRIPREVAPPPKVERMEPFNFTPVALGNPADVLDVAQYENEIYRTLRQCEKKAPTLSFHQTDITLTDRNLLVDAVCRVHYKLGLTTNTFYRFLGILDRYFTVSQVSQSNLKVVAAACFLIASKIEDIYPAQSQDLISLMEQAFSQRELFSTEISVINAIGFDTTFGTPLFYLTHFMRINGQTKESLLLARYILEISQSNEHFYGMPPSKMAAIAVFVTRILTKEPVRWPQTLSSFTQYSENDIGPSANWIREMLIEEDRPETRFMRRKYGSELFLSVSHISHIPPTFY